MSGTPLDFETVKPNSDAQFHDGLLFGLQSSGKLVYYNHNGQEAFILPANIVPVTDFAEQRAVVRNTDTGLFGYINTKGNIAIPCQFASAWGFSGGVAYVKQNNAAGEALIDRKGNLVTSLTESFSSEFYFSEGLAMAYAPNGSGRIGYINTAGKLAIPYKYFSHSRPFSGGLALVENSAGLYGYIDKSGKTVIPFKYTSGGDFSEGLAAVQNAKGKWGFINRKGKVMIPFMYDNAGNFSEGLAHVYNVSGKVGFINTRGKLVIGYQKYNSAFSFKEGIALVGISNPADNTKDKYGYINTKGELLTKLIYTRESSSFSGGYAVGVTDLGTGYILNKL
ncbi:WG repeat-containing protein [Paenibacillus tianjinensis]|uniref:WG repeat-containing protein n=1 Tax=Paenibacillus tianjinensis TaxID=2810347 RepID=UPI001E496895|nr:WG repeat-containing protein [Paenibacillus tianjinensis]